AAQGLPHTGVTPFGYERVLLEESDDDDAEDTYTLVENEAEAEAIRWARVRVMDGATLSSVAREWNSRGLKTAKYGQEFEWGSVKAVLTNPALAGYRAYQPTSILTGGTKRKPSHKADLIKGNWRPIFDKSEWDAMVLVLTTNRTSAGNRIKYLGGGI